MDLQQAQETPKPVKQTQIQVQVLLPNPNQRKHEDSGTENQVKELDENEKELLPYISVASISWNPEWKLQNQT